jgi:hypothetical protein
MTSARVSVSHEQGNLYRVTVEEDGRHTSHDVMVWPSDVQRYAPGSSPEELLQASFAFLLQREPKEAILRRFDLSDIERYFPDYPRAMRGLS